VANTFVLVIETPDDTEVDRAQLESLLSLAAYQVVRGGVVRPIVSGQGDKLGYWAIYPGKLKVDIAKDV
jgi:hypothetical protein